MIYILNVYTLKNINWFSKSKYSVSFLKSHHYYNIFSFSKPTYYRFTFHILFHCFKYGLNSTSIKLSFIKEFLSKLIKQSLQKILLSPKPSINSIILFEPHLIHFVSILKNKKSSLNLQRLHIARNQAYMPKSAANPATACSSEALLGFFSSSFFVS